ncbi:purine-nucleoside phosphorylase [bacterium]|nr:purine-nucleoside phosphorylase [bacterium]
MHSLKSKVDEAASAIRVRFGDFKADTGLILGSGLGPLADRLDGRQAVETASIPHWPESTVAGHSGRLVCGRMGSVPVFVLQGRVHYYEGYTMDQVTFCVRVLGRLGVKRLIVTNAAGGLNPEFSAGDLMLITDHINLMGTNPLIGYFDPEADTRFPDMSAPYDPELRDLAVVTAKALKITLRQGVLAVTTGPSYETASEVRMLQILGGDAVCMSTVPEVIVAVQMGMHVLGISCITNPATGLGSRPLSHLEVKETAGRIQETFVGLLTGIVGRMGAGAD